MHHITKYYVTGHTADGFVNFLSSNLINIKKIIVLQHSSNSIKSRLLQKIIALYEEKEQVEMILSAQTNEYIDGVIMRESSLAILDERLIQGSIERAEYVDVRKYIPIENEEESSIEDSTRKINNLQKKAYDHFKTGLAIHDDLEKVYINEMNFEKADKIANEWIDKLFGDHKKKDEKSV